MIIVSVSKNKWLAAMAAEEGTIVELYIYDLTNGLASLVSPSILGKLIM